MNVKEENYRKRMTLGQDGNALIQLLILNAVLFVILKFVYVIYLVSDKQLSAYYTHVYNWFALPADPRRLAMRPWTIISYMFTDYELFRFISNMFWLWTFGYILQDLTGNRKIIAIYLYGGLTGALLFILGHLFIPGLSG